MTPVPSGVMEMSVEIDVRDLVGHPGASRTVRVRPPLEGLVTELARVPEDSPVDADLLMESVVEGILASGALSGVMALSCARCLRPFQEEFRVDVRELFAPGAAPEGDDYSLDEGFLDLEPLIRDAVVLAMPFAPLCRADCLGLCPRCGGDRNAGECTCAEEFDPRWGRLSGLQFRMEPKDRGDRSDRRGG
jgi:DUF177 domain-containing protein